MKCTRDNSIFTNDQRLFYKKNGYIIIRNNIDPALLDKLCRRFVDICEGLTDDYNVHIIKDPVLRKKGASGQYAVNKIQDFVYDDVLWEYASNKAIVDVVEQIIGPNITIVNSILVNKPPNSDPDISRHPLHQDMHYFPCRSADKIVASWTAMERTDERNGCLHVIPGSHKGPLYNHDYPEGFRKAISCHYADSNCDLIDVTNTSHEKMANEFEEFIEKRTGERVSYLNTIRVRSRLVRGSPGKLQQLECHF